VVYIQKEELKLIDFFLDYPMELVNTVNPITGAIIPRCVLVLGDARAAAGRSCSAPSRFTRARHG
jgi:hypothetical protein